MKVLYIFAAFLIIFMGACKKQVLNPEVSLFKVAEDKNTQTILALGQDTLLAGIGTLYTNGGMLYKSVDKGENWQPIFNLSQAPMALSQHNNKLYTIAFGSEFYHSNSQDNDWGMIHLLGWGYWSDIAINNSGKAIAVGGLNFAEGYIQPIDLNTYNGHLPRATFQHELKAITFVNDTIAIAVGYGTILRSENAGESWQYLGYSGDFYRDIQMVNDNTIFIVGLYGSVLLSKDKGLSWKEISKPNSLSQKNRFKKAYFYSENLGWAAGDNGQLWQTNNGGKDWLSINTKTTYDFNDIIYQAPYLYLATDEGYVLRVTL